MIDGLGTAHALLGLAAAFGALAWRRGARPIGLARLVGAGLAVAAIAAAQLAVLVPRVRRGWGAVDLLWHDLLIVPAVVGAWLVTRGRGRVTPAARALGACGVLLLPVLLHANLRAPFDLRIEEARVGLDPARGGASALRVGVLADLQTSAAGAYERRAVEALVAASPDLVLVPGDLYQGPPERFAERLPGLRALLERLAAVAPTVLVEGDCDEPEELAALVPGTGVRRLADEVLRLRLRDRDVSILGLPNECIRAASQAAVRAFEDAPSDADVRIVVAHKPGAVRLLREGTRVDLLVAGHTHGGQVVLPGFGPPATFSAVPRAVAAGGLHELEGRRLYVSRGVGHEQPPAPRLRFLCPPEVSVLTLTSTGEGSGR